MRRDGHRTKGEWRQEVLGGLTTFMSMAYIIFVQPVVLAEAGMDGGAVLAATCLASAAATFLMGFLADYPIALAPGMGQNFFFTYTVVLTLGYTWQQALGAVFVSGVLFVLLAGVGLRERLIESVPDCLKSGIGAGIGLLIATVGLQWGGLVVDHPVTLVTLGSLHSSAALLCLAGLSVTAALLARGVGAALLAGILFNTTVAWAAGLVPFEGVWAPVPSLSPTLLALDLRGLVSWEMLAVVFIFFFLDLFDTVGTLIGVTRDTGLMREDGTLPNAGRAFLADALGTCMAGLLGTSAVTSYIESSTGISAGARTGRANLVTGTLFLAALFFSPLIKMVGGGISQGDGRVLYPIVAPALILVGSLMLRGVAHLRWKDPTEAIPTFLTLLVMPLSFSITEGIAFGFLSYTVLKLAAGRRTEIPPLIGLFSVLFLLRYLWLVA